MRKPRWRAERPSSEKIRVCAIGDTHTDPNIPNDRFAWIGRHINKTRPDIVIQIGDLCNADSVNSKYIPNSTLEGRQKPSIKDDLVHMSDALGLLESELSYRPDKHVTLGNHDHRFWAFENSNPESDGLASDEFVAIIEDHRWTWSEFGEYFFVNGVAFSHVPLNVMGNPFGGKTSGSRIGNDAVFDIVYGHRHQTQFDRVSKLGQGRFVQVLNVGCALPHGHLERYARHSLNGWSWGIVDMIIQNGHIESWAWVPMTSLS